MRMERYEIAQGLRRFRPDDRGGAGVVRDYRVLADSIS